MRLAEMRAALQGGEPGVLVMVADSRGSAPREAGAAMLVTRARAIGTIGGGAAEAQALARARAFLKRGAVPAQARRQRVALGPALDQCCGGQMTLAFGLVAESDLRGGEIALWPGGPSFAEPLQTPLWLYGAGHVGRALVRALAPLPFAVTWVDPRPDPFDPALVGLAAACEATPLPEASVARAPAAAAHLVMTHSHAVDLEIVAAVLERGAFGRLGLIGSRTKRTVFERKLRDRGISDAQISRLVCPIGRLAPDGAKPADKSPAAIAALVAAELLLWRAERQQILEAAE